MRVAVLGLGAMGTAIARRLMAAGVELSVYNRTPQKARELEAAGAHVAATPGAAAETADVAISMVADGPAVAAVLVGPDGVLESDAPPPIVIDMSTIDVPTSARIAEQAGERGVAFL